VIVKFTELEVRTPGAGLLTVTAGMPVEAIAAAGMAAVNCVELTNVVVGAAPPKLTTEPATKFAPLIVSVKAAPPARAVVGEIVLIDGGSGGGGGVCSIELLPPHLARPDRAKNKTRAHLAREKALSFMEDPPHLKLLFRSWTRKNPPTIARGGFEYNGEGMVCTCFSSDRAAQ
jgi:hypothetical protein